jgi:hypothetical protein
MKELEVKISSLKAEIEELMKEKDIEPEREQGVIRNRQGLKDIGVFLLYHCIEQLISIKILQKILEGL